MIYGFSPFGYEGSVIQVEADLRRGIPATDIVGLADGAVRECRERMMAAIRNSGYDYPSERVLISLSPADLKKEGAGFDLSVALAVLSAQAGIDENVMAIGALELSGNVRMVNGIHAALYAARAAEVYKVVIPAGYNGEIPAGINVCRVKNLKEAFEVVRTGKGFGSVGMVYDRPPFGLDDSEMYAFDGIKGLNFLKYALAVAAAGGHHLIAWGSHGCGKTRLIQHLPYLIPALEVEERSQVERIYDLAGYVPKAGIGWDRPFRAPHQTATIEGMCGGGLRLAPGEVTLAHNGVLFLDEAAEFKSSVLQMLRVPLEGGSITLSRAGRSTVYPARFQLVMATHPCPCGNLGSKDKMCLCSSSSVEQYWRKFSGPLLDRVPIRVDCNEDMACENVLIDALREKVSLAYRRQMDRQGKRNQFLAPDELADMRERMTDGARHVVEARETDLTPRAVSNLVKVAATVADMEGHAQILEDDALMAEKLCGKLPLENL